MNISLDMTGMTKTERGMLSVVESDKINNLKADMSLDPDQVNGLQSVPIINVEGFGISEINYPIEGGGYIKTKKLDFGNAKMTNKSKVLLKDIQATDFILSVPKGEK